MASSKEYVNFILEQCEGLSVRAMMGEYVRYYDGKVIGGVYDNRLLVKVWLSNYPENLHPLDMRRFYTFAQNAISYHSKRWFTGESSESTCSPHGESLSFSSVRLCRDTFYGCLVPVPLLIPQLMDR